MNHPLVEALLIVAVAVGLLGWATWEFFKEVASNR